MSLTASVAVACRRMSEPLSVLQASLFGSLGVSGKPMLGMRAAVFGCAAALWAAAGVNGVAAL